VLRTAQNGPEGDQQDFDQLADVLSALGSGILSTGLFVTTESWLNIKASPAERGRLLSVYMVGTFIAVGPGQPLIGWAEGRTAQSLS
jgi:hypothetical protein